MLRGEEDVTIDSAKVLSGASKTVVTDDMIPENLRELPMDRLVVWIDPLDATRSYVNGNLSDVTCLIGVAMDGRPVLGIINHMFAENSPTYYGGPGIPVRKTINAFKDAGTIVSLPPVPRCSSLV